MGSSPWGRKESDATERLSKQETHSVLFCINCIRRGAFQKGRRKHTCTNSLPKHVYEVFPADLSW